MAKADRGRPLWSRWARAPGKVILFGEHAVVYGHPAVALAIDLPTTVHVTAYGGGETTLSGCPEGFAKNRYLLEAAKIAGAEGLDVRVRSGLPRASGLGSSAALSSAFLAALLPEPLDRVDLARKSFLAEFNAQRQGSPVDTSTVTAGGVVGVGLGSAGVKLWEVPAVEGRGPWGFTRLRDPGWTWVVAYSGLPKATGPAVKAVGERLKEDTTHLLDRIARVTHDGSRALLEGNREEVGRQMNLNHELLVELGVGHDRLAELVEAVKGRVLGVKITGAGRGGSLVALPRPGDEAAVANLFSSEGALVFPVTVTKEGTGRLSGPAW